jgi:hypothetical protein
MRRKNPHAVALGRKGGKRGGRARWAGVRPEVRSEILKRAALVRWGRAAPRERPVTPWCAEADPFRGAKPLKDASRLIGGLPDARPAEAILSDARAVRARRKRAV